MDETTRNIVISFDGQPKYLYFAAEHKKIIMKKRNTLLGLFLFWSVIAFGQSGFWSSTPRVKALSKEGQRIYEPVTSMTYHLNLNGLKSALTDVPKEFSAKGKIVDLPMADGRIMAFELFDSPVMAPGLAARYPMIKTFSGRAVANSKITGRFSYGTDGFHGYILGAGSPVIIDPIYYGDDQLYQVFFRKDLQDRSNPDKAFVCDVEPDYPSTAVTKDETQVQNREVLGAPVQLRKYRMAMATTGEYSAKYGGTAASVLSEVVNVVNRLNSIEERDFAIRFELIANTDILFQFDAANDPYTNGDTGKMIGENAAAIGATLTFDSYDIGHVLGTNGGGLAQLRSVCSGAKARGVTSAGGYNGDQFYVDYVAHEVGHQLGSNHTFNNCSGFAAGNENAGTAYEPGSGSTIMSYSGICGINNIVFDSYPYYHVSSLIEISDYMKAGGGNGCAQKSNTDNHYPTANIPLEDDFYIPVSTAFKLNGVGADEDGDSLTYSWEEFDLGPLSDIGSPEGNAPIFEVLPLTTKTYRIFPKLNNVFSGVFDKREVLPTYSRDLTFQFVVRDNHDGGGAAAWDKVAFHATADAGPFVVTRPGLSDKVWDVGEYALVEWNVANTDKEPVNCKLVNVRLIKGLDYDNSILLAQNVPNNGAVYVTVPDMVGNNYHLIVEAADNIFFDASSSSHKIQQPTGPKLSASLSLTSLQMCVPTTEQVNIQTVGLGGYTGDVTFELLGALPAGAQASFESAGVSVGESTNLVLDFNNVQDFQPVDLQVVVKGSGVDSVVMDLHLDVKDFNFSSLAGVSPENGATGVGIFPALTWTPLANAQTYDVQIASSPSFDASSIVQEKLGTTANELALVEELAVSTQYFWRVKAHNACGAGEWMIPSSFSTINQNCNTVASTDVPKLISGNNPGTTISTLSVSSSGSVGDLNVDHLKGDHKYLGEIEIKLIAPSGESAILMSHKCGNSSVAFDLSFDDDALASSPCSLNGKVKPAEPLSVFQGLNVNGDWKLSVTDNVVGSGGHINAWGLELCTDAAANAPVLVKNEPMHINIGWNQILDNSLLLAEDVDNGPDELIFTLVLAPKHGALKLWDTEVPVGGHFSQSEITAGALRYFNDNDGSVSEDEFYFSVADGQGGFIPVTKYNIQIIPVGTHEMASQNFEIYPNPVKEMVNIFFGSEMVGAVDIRLVDVAGRVLKHRSLKEAAGTQLSVRDLAAGTYFVHIVNQGQTGVKKVVVLGE